MKFKAPDCKNCPNRDKSIFSFCCEDELDELDFAKTGHLYQKGHVLFQERGKPLGLYCLNKGKVKISKQNNEGKEQIIRLAQPGDPVGYRSLLSGSPYTATATVLEESIICFIPNDYFQKLLKKNSAVGARLLIMLSDKLGEAEEKIAALALKPVRERLAEALLLLNKIYNSEGKDNSFAISREDLGNLVGTAKETAIRLLAEFKEKNIIKTQGSKIKILDSKKLLKISQLHD